MPHLEIDEPIGSCRVERYLVGQWTSTQHFGQVNQGRLANGRPGDRGRKWRNIGGHEPGCGFGGSAALRQNQRHRFAGIPHAVNGQQWLIAHHRTDVGIEIKQMLAGDHPGTPRPRLSRLHTEQFARSCICVDQNANHWRNSLKLLIERGTETNVSTSDHATTARSLPLVRWLPSLLP
jgi:hypothetical protein